MAARRPGGRGGCRGGGGPTVKAGNASPVECAAAVSVVAAASMAADVSTVECATAVEVAAAAVSAASSVEQLLLRQKRPPRGGGTCGRRGGGASVPAANPTSFEFVAEAAVADTAASVAIAAVEELQPRQCSPRRRRLRQRSPHRWTAATAVNIVAQEARRGGGRL